MNTKQLRQKILDLAIHGKLVPQDPADEPASVLLVRIAEEKARLVKEGKIKADKVKASAVSSDKSHYGEFDIPKSWKWVTLSQITAIISDGDHQPPPQSDCGVPFLVISDVRSGAIIFNNARYVSRDYYDSLVWARKPYKGDVLFTVTGSYGIPIDVKVSEPFCFQRHIALLRPCIVESGFLALFLKADMVKQQCDQLATGIAQKTVGLESLRKIAIPLPPIVEQHRIVTAIESAFAVIDEIDRNKSDLQSAVTSAKQKILTLAMRGKLVPQDENDEPASELLKRIKAERDKLIKAGKIKADKREKDWQITRDNSHYEKLPESWAVATFGEVCDIYTGNSINETEKKQKYLGQAEGMPYIGTKDVSMSGQIDYDNGVRIPDTSDFKVAPPNSVFLCIEGGNAGKKIALTAREVCFGNKLCCFAPFLLNSDFVYYFVNSDDFSTAFRSNINGIIGGVSVNKLKTLEIPIPPIAEQERIAEAVKSQFQILDEIASNITN